MKQEAHTFTRYEIARILGARSLQLAMDAPILLKLTKEDEEALYYDALKIAEREFESGVLPITFRRPMPKRSEKQIKKLTEEELKEKLEEQTKLEKEVGEVVEHKDKVEKTEERGEKEVEQDGEIMEMANPVDEESLEEDDSGEEI